MIRKHCFAFLKVVISISITLILVALISCTTTYGKDYKDTEALIYGMVNDGSDCPIKDVHVFIDGKIKAISDIQGRFIIKYFFGKMKEETKHKITLKKDGYEEVEQEIFYDPMGLFYFKMRSAQEISRNAEIEIDAGKYESAFVLAKKIQKIKGFEIDGAFLSAIIRMKQGKKQEAIQILEAIDEKNKYVTAFLKKLR